MAQLSSVQREPSMEEILASIRRIIEDSDLPKPTGVSVQAAPSLEGSIAGPQPAEPVSGSFQQSQHEEYETYARGPASEIEPTIVPAAANEDRPSAFSRTYDFESRDDVYDTAAQHIDPEVQLPADKTSSTSLTDWNLDILDEAVVDELSDADFDLAEVADAVLKELSNEPALAELTSARVEPLTADAGSTHDESDADASELEAVNASSVATMPDVEPASFVVEPTRSAILEPAALAVVPAPAEVEPEGAETDAEFAAADEPVTLAAETVEPAITSAPAAFELPPAAVESAAAALALANSNEPQHAAIISEHAGRQVTASFNELADAFAAKGYKTLDKAAEELMRPMLQEWLDNNLPTMVERLVREEIERVARGFDA